MAHRLVWAAAVILAALALVAGCFSVDVPKGPYVTLDGGSRAPSPKDRERVGSMDKQALEDEVLRLGAENDSLRQQVEKLKREKKVLESEKDRLEDRVKSLEDQVKDLRRR